MLPRLPPIGTSTIGRAAFGGSAIEQCEALDAGGPANPGHRWAPHQLDQAVIAPTGQYGALRAKIGCDELEDRMRVVIQAAHQSLVQAVGNADAVEPGPHFGEEIARRVIAKILEARRLGVEPDIAGVF